MLEVEALLRSVAFALIFAGIEYRYINREEASWTKDFAGFNERPAFWVISPYHAYFLLPLFIVVAFALPMTAWAANAFLIAVAEDVAYFVWRGKAVQPGEWTTTLFGSFRAGGLVIPAWWPLDLGLAAVLLLVPF